MGGEAGRAPSGGLRSCACSRTGWGRHHHHQILDLDVVQNAQSHRIESFLCSVSGSLTAQFARTPNSHSPVHFKTTNSEISNMKIFQSVTVGPEPTIMRAGCCSRQDVCIKRYLDTLASSNLIFLQKSPLEIVNGQNHVPVVNQIIIQL